MPEWHELPASLLEPPEEPVKKDCGDCACCNTTMYCGDTVYIHESYGGEIVWRFCSEKCAKEWFEDKLWEDIA